MTEILPDRLARLIDITLLTGIHKPPPDDDNIQGCAMEVLSWLVGAPWSDHHDCVCPTLAAFVRSWNDGLNDDDRNTILKPLIPALVNTRGSNALDERRSMMAADWLIRVHTPAWLRLAKLDAHADALEALPEITSQEQMPAIQSLINAARRDAAAARAAAGAAAWDAAWAAARAAARVAAGDALEPTKRYLQASARELLERMIGVEEIQSMRENTKC